MKHEQIGEAGQVPEGVPLDFATREKPLQPAQGIISQEDTQLLEEESLGEGTDEDSARDTNFTLEPLDPETEVADLTGLDVAGKAYGSRPSSFIIDPEDRESFLEVAKYTKSVMTDILNDNYEIVTELDKKSKREAFRTVDALLSNIVYDMGLNAQFINDLEDFNDVFEMLGSPEVTRLVNEKGYKFPPILQKQLTDSIATYYHDYLLDAMETEGIRELDVSDPNRKADTRVAYQFELVTIEHSGGSISFAPRQYTGDNANRMTAFSKSTARALNQDFSEAISNVLRMQANIAGVTFDRYWASYGPLVFENTYFIEAAFEASFVPSKENK